MTQFRAVHSILLAAVLLAGCDTTSTNPETTSTWSVIEHDILQANCAGCHAEGTSFARQSGLILTPDAAYAQLLGVEPTNRTAADAGLVRLSDEGLAGVSRSFLWEKINAPAQEHFYADHPDYGEIMPLGRAPLTNGQLEFIRRWIAAGAPQTGVVADESLLADEQRYQLPPFQPLAPEAGSLHLHLEPFEVGTDFEREVFRYIPLNNAEDLFVNSFRMRMRPGSHHFILYTYPETTPAEDMPEPEILRDLRDPETGSYEDSLGFDVFNWRNMLYAKPLVISQSRQFDFELPDGVAVRLPAGSGVDVNAHYVNTQEQAIQGEAFVNLGLIDSTQVRHEARVFAMSNFDIELPAGQVTTLEKEFFFKEDRRIMLLVSHAHDRMVEFTAEMIGGERDGELMYVSHDWEHPAPLRFDPPLQVHEGEGLRLRATYDNNTGRDLYFGYTRTDAEMMILYGYYYSDN